MNGLYPLTWTPIFTIAAVVIVAGVVYHFLPERNLPSSRPRSVMQLLGLLSRLVVAAICVGIVLSSIAGLWSLGSVRSIGDDDNGWLVIGDQTSKSSATAVQRSYRAAERWDGVLPADHGARWCHPVHQRGAVTLNTFDFKFHNLTIRAVEIEGNPWFVAKDVCEAMGMDLYAGSSRWLAALSPSDKLRVKRSEAPGLFGEGRGAPTLNLISESGLYKLVLRSDKPEATEFQHWVTSVVLPAIRKTEQTAEESAGGRLGAALCRTSGNLKWDLLGVPERFDRQPTVGGGSGPQVFSRNFLSRYSYHSIHLISPLPPGGTSTCFPVLRQVVRRTKVDAT